jgi:YgiT-type zinc finger domain-containing protein
MCGIGPLTARAVDLQRSYDGALSVIRHVPARVCVTCGQRFFSYAVLRKIDRIIREEKPKKEMIPAYHFPKELDPVVA